MPDPFATLVQELARLPGLGRRSAERAAPAAGSAIALSPEPIAAETLSARTATAFRRWETCSSR